MSNPFYNAFNNGRNFFRDPRQMVNDIQKNPIQALRDAGYNLPDNINDPRQIVQHLMSSGQVTQSQVDNAQMMARRMGVKF